MLIGEASIRIDALTADLKKQVNKDLNDALKNVKVDSDPLTRMTQNIAKAELDLVKAQDEATAAGNKTLAAEKALSVARAGRGDTTVAVAKAERDLRTAELESIVSGGKVSEATDKVSRAHRDYKKAADDAGKSTSNLDKIFGAITPSINKMTSGVLSTLTGVGKLAGGFAGLSSVIQIVPAIAAGIAQLAGASLLAVPAGFALAGVMGAVKLGAAGAKDAFDKLTPTLDTIKKKVSDAFEKALLPAVKNLEQTLPQLTGGLAGITTAVGGVAVKFTAMLKAGSTTKQLQDILSGTAKLVTNVGNGLAPIIQAFIRIGAVAMPILVQLTAGFGAAGDKFNALIQRMSDTGSLTAWIQSGISGFKSIFQVVGDLGTIIKSVFDALESAGGGLTGVLGGVIGSVKDFVTSAQGSATLTSLASAINAIGTAVGTVLSAALKAIAPAIPSLVSAFSQLVALLTPDIVAIVQALGTAFGKLAEFLAANMKWIGPVAITIATLVGVIKGVILVMELWEAITYAMAVAQAVLDAVMDANPIGIIVLAIVALIAAIVLVVTNLGFFRKIWDSVWKFVSDIVTKTVAVVKSVFSSVVSWLSGAANSIGSFFTGLGSKIATGFTAIVNFFKELPGKIGSFLASLPGIIGKALLDALKFAANAVLQGIEWITAEFIALPFQIAAGLIKLYDIISKAFTDAINAVIAWIPGAFTTVVNFFIALPGNILSAVKDFGAMIGTWMHNAWETVKNAVVSGIQAVISFVIQLPGKVISAVSSLGSSLGQFFVNAWNSAKNAVVAGVGNVVDFIKQLPGKVLAGLGDLGSLLAKAGKAIVQGFIDGIKAAWGAVTSVVSGLLDKVRKLLPFSPAKEGPFSGRGWVLYSGMSIPAALADGIAANAHKAVGATAELVAAVNAQLTGNRPTMNLATSLPDLPSATDDARAAQAKYSAAMTTALGGVQVQQASMAGDLVDALGSVQVVVSATQANNAIQKVQSNITRRQ